jgi:hypothetical protein
MDDTPPEARFGGVFVVQVNGIEVAAQLGVFDDIGFGKGAGALSAVSKGR